MPRQYGLFCRGLSFIKHQETRYLSGMALAAGAHQDERSQIFSFDPLTPRFLLVHNTNLDKIDEYKTTGLPPSAGLATEQDTFQAWIKLADDPIELAAWIAKEFAKYDAPTEPLPFQPRTAGRFSKDRGLAVWLREDSQKPPGSTSI